MTILGNIVHLIAVAIFVAAMLQGAATDLARYEIPNWTSLAIVAAYPFAALAAGFGTVDILIGFAVGAGCLVIGIGLFAFNLFGGGDVKLLAAGAVWAGWTGLPAYLLVIVLAGGLLSLFLLIFRRLPLPRALRAVGWIEALHGGGAKVPYGVAIAGGALMLLPVLPVARHLFSL
jgi:prepilin peptidase CpaA